MRIRGSGISRLALVIFVLVGSLVAECSMNAAVQVFDVSEMPAPANLSESEIQIPQFDPSLGSLHSITLDLQGTGVFLEGFDHPSEGHHPLSMQQHFTLVLETSTDQGLITLSQTANHSMHGGAVGDSEGTQLDRVRVAGETILTSQSALKEFTGSGLVDLFLSARSGPGTHFGNGHSILNGFWMAGANIKVSYEYAPIPEASWWWLGDGAVIILVCATLGLSSRRQPEST
jgi:hypothetical protein